MALFIGVCRKERDGGFFLEGNFDDVLEIAQIYWVQVLFVCLFVSLLCLLLPLCS